MLLEEVGKMPKIGKEFSKELTRSALKYGLGASTLGLIPLIHGEGVKTGYLEQKLFSEKDFSEATKISTKAGVKANTDAGGVFSALLPGLLGSALSSLGARKNSLILTGIGLGLVGGQVLGVIPHMLSHQIGSSFYSTQDAGISKEEYERKMKKAILANSLITGGVLGTLTYKFKRHYPYYIGLLGKGFNQWMNFALRGKDKKKFLAGLLASGALGTYITSSAINRLTGLQNRVYEKELFKSASEKKDKKDDTLRKALIGALIGNAAILGIQAGVGKYQIGNILENEVDDKRWKRYLDPDLYHEIAKKNVEVKVVDLEGFHSPAAIKNTIFIPQKMLDYIETKQEYYKNLGKEISKDKYKYNREVSKKLKRGFSSVIAHELEHATSWHTRAPRFLLPALGGIATGTAVGKTLASISKDKDKNELAFNAGLTSSILGFAITNSIVSNIAERQADRAAIKRYGRSALRSGLNLVLPKNLGDFQKELIKNTGNVPTFRTSPPRSKIGAIGEVLKTLFLGSHPPTWTRVWDLKTLKKALKTVKK
ncbi:MAG: hypothetical protein DSY42_07375 [Aquifex sp.]|nr:MAG: hypothetical protein DSY42_07375 [Aquifex sp.]